jgi:NADPH:quinone reductase-like Zn-dependent oxidoreductase
MRVKRVLGVVVGGGVLLLTGAGAASWARSTNDCADTAAEAPRDPIRAVVYCEYGGPEVLRLQRIEKPVPGDSQVLVRVHAAAINPLDWHHMRGTPYIGRLSMGMRVPATTRLGADFAGTVEAVGVAVTRFSPGDAVFGARTGALGEYVVARHDRVVHKPSTIDFDHAAAIPVAGITALQALRDHGRLQPGQRVLINGASGGVGTFAVQIAKAHGAHVTGVSSARNVDLVRSIGADDAIDYTTRNFTRTGERWDVIIDNVGNHRLRDLRRALMPDGAYVMVGGPSGQWLDPLPRSARTWFYSMFVQPDMRFFLSRLNHEDLAALGGLVDAGLLKPVIDRRYTLDDATEAIRYLETGRARGKVIVVMQ